MRIGVVAVIGGATSLVEALSRGEVVAAVCVVVVVAAAVVSSGVVIAAAAVCIAVVITADVAAFPLLLSQALWVWHATGTITLHLTH